MTFKPAHLFVPACSATILGGPSPALAEEVPGEAAPGAADEAPAKGREYRHAIEVSPMSFLFRIYAVQYAYAFSENNEFITGFAYQNIQHPVGTTNSPTLIVGYRRYVWDKFSVEYQLWPAFDEPLLRVHPV